MSLIKKIQITAINPIVAREKKAGGTYECFHIKYVDDQGQPKNEYIARFGLKTNPMLEKDLNALVPGEVVLLHYKKVGAYDNLYKVEKTDETAAPVEKQAPQKAAAPAPSRGFSGPTIGMALNNAVLLKVHTGDVRPLEEIAAEILFLSTKLEKDYSAGRFHQEPEDGFFSKQKIAKRKAAPADNNPFEIED